MTRFKSIFFMLFLCATFANSVQAATFIMWAEGEAETLKDAKTSAITALSQQVIAKVESSFKTELAVTNDEVNRDSKSIKKIDSKMILKGVVFVDEVRANGNVKITAGLDRAAIRSTIEYMQAQLNVDFTILSRDKKEEKLTVSDQLTAFVSVLPASILNDFENIDSWNKNKRDLILKNIFMARVVFVSNTPNYTVTIDKNPAQSGLFLEEANYEFSASAEGRRAMIGHFYASGGETVKVKLDFVKTVTNKKIHLHLPKGYGYLKEDLVDTLSDIGVIAAASAKNELLIRVKKTASEVDGYISYQLIVRIEANKNKVRVKKVTLRKNITVEQGEESTVQRAITKLAVKGTVALMSRMDLDTFF